MYRDEEKLCLKWNDFQENLNSAFGVLRNDKEFSDVTLACEDGTQVETHKVILASSSPFFMEILKKNRHPHPLIYMRGIKAENLVAIVDFLYFGEANVDQEHLNDFLALAEELRLKGLTGSTESNERKCLPEEPSAKKRATIQPQPGPVAKMPKPKEMHHFDEPSSIMPVSLVNADLQLLNEQVKSMMEISDNTIITGNRTTRAFICKVCGKEGHPTNIKTHIEANHITSDVDHSCDICGKSSRSRNGLRLHKAKEHYKSF